MKLLKGLFFRIFKRRHGNINSAFFYSKRMLAREKTTTLRIGGTEIRRHYLTYANGHVEELTIKEVVRLN